MTVCDAGAQNSRLSPPRYGIWGQNMQAEFLICNSSNQKLASSFVISDAIWFISYRIYHSVKKLQNNQLKAAKWFDDA